LRVAGLGFILTERGVLCALTEVSEVLSKKILMASIIILVTLILNTFIKPSLGILWLFSFFMKLNGHIWYLLWKYKISLGK